MCGHWNFFSGTHNNLDIQFDQRSVPKSTSLITFIQFLFVSLEGSPKFIKIEKTVQRHPSLKGYIPRTVQTQTPLLPYKFTLAPTAVPKYHWIVMVILFWSVSLLNNLALEYRVDMTLHIIFKSSSLVVNMLFGSIIGKSYSLRQVLGVLSVTFGVLYFTILSSSTANAGHDSKATAEWIYGIYLMTVSLIISAVLGLYQEQIYIKYGKHWREGLFYTHFLGLPFFLLFASSLVNQASQTIKAHAVSWLLANAITQVLCIAGVHWLSSVSSSLTVAFVLTLRKFVSLLLSLFYFEKSFTLGHALGTCLVFLGSLLYSSATNKEKKEDAKSSPLPIVRRRSSRKHYYQVRMK